MPNAVHWTLEVSVKDGQISVFKELFKTAVTPVSFIVLGHPSADLCVELAGLNPRCLKLEARFSRYNLSCFYLLIRFVRKWALFILGQSQGYKIAAPRSSSRYSMIFLRCFFSL